MKAMFTSKRARPDVQPVVSFLATRTTCSTNHDWAKLSRMMNFLFRTKDEVLKFSADGSYKIIWYVDAAFAVHPNMRSHTGAIMTMGKGAIQTISSKQKMKSTERTNHTSHRKRTLREPRAQYITI